MLKLIKKLLIAASVILTLSAPAFGCDGKVVGASWYGYELAGNKTASGQPFNPAAMTAAHKSLPLGTKVRVTYNGKSAVVRINDRGPYVKDRSIDLSLAAAKKIGLKKRGHGKVCLEVL